MSKSFHRDRFFWIVATQTAIVNFYLGGFGPAQSLLRADQGTSLTIAGLHGTAMGIASIFAGYANPYIAHRLGRTRAGWTGLAIFTLGLTLFVISPPDFLTLPATLIGLAADYIGIRYTIAVCGGLALAASLFVWIKYRDRVGIPTDVSVAAVLKTANRDQNN